MRSSGLHFVIFGRQQVWFSTQRENSWYVFLVFHSPSKYKFWASNLKSPFIWCYTSFSSEALSLNTLIKLWTGICSCQFFPCRIQQITCCSRSVKDIQRFIGFNWNTRVWVTCDQCIVPQHVILWIHLRHFYVIPLIDYAVQWFDRWGSNCFIYNGLVSERKLWSVTNFIYLKQ